MSNNCFPSLPVSQLQPRDQAAPELELNCEPAVDDSNPTAEDLLTASSSLPLAPLPSHFEAPQPALMSLDVFLAQLRRHHLPTRAKRLRLGLRMARRRYRCAICQETVKEKTVVPSLTCLHTFHRGCLEKWRRRHDSCPLCREPLT